MVHKDVLFQTFMKLESYDRINIISDLLKFSNHFELEFYSSIIGSVLQYQKMSFDSLKEELNHDDNILHLRNTDSTDSSTRSKLISTLSLLKVSNVSGAAHLFECLRRNHGRLKALAEASPSTYEEVLLIYQLANDHPAFSYSHCREIYDYLQAIRAVPVVNNYSEIQIKDECLVDLNVISVEKNELQQYVYHIKVDWTGFGGHITRTLEDIYRFYTKLCEIFPTEAKNGKICALYLSYIPDNLDFSKSLMTKFLRDFLNSPQHVLHSDFVRQFFKPRITDKHYCDYDTSPTNSKKFHWTIDQRFDNISNCSSPNNPSDNEEYTQSFDNKTEASSYSNFDFSSTSKCHSNNLPLGVSINNQTGSDDSSDSSLKPNRNKNRTFHSSGSSPINTPSDESEICHKNDSSKHSNEICRQLNKEMKKNDIMPLTKDLRTKNWLCQSSNSISDSSKSIGTIETFNGKSELECLEQNSESEDSQTSDVSQFDTCQIGNLLDWLKEFRLHKYYSCMPNLKFGDFRRLTEDALNDMGFVDGASKKLISLIRNLKPNDIKVVNKHVIDLKLANRSISNDSSRSLYGSNILEANPHSVMVVTQPFLCHPYPNSTNFIMVTPNIVQFPNTYSALSDKQQFNEANINS